MNLQKYHLEQFNKRLHSILLIPHKQCDRLTLFLSDMQGVFDIPDKVDQSYEKANQNVMQLYRMAKVAREDVK